MTKHLSQAIRFWDVKQLKHKKKMASQKSKKQFNKTCIEIHRKSKYTCKYTTQLISERSVLPAQRKI